MASYGYTFTSGDSVTPTKLNSARTVSDIVNADISATAAIAATKLASDSITNAQIKSDAAIAGTKIAPNFGAQNIVTSGTATIGGVTVESASPVLFLKETDAAANNQNWDIIANGTSFFLRAVNDAYTSAANAVQVARSGTTLAGMSVSTNVSIAGSASSLELYNNTPSIRFSSSPNKTNNYFVGANISDSVNGVFAIGTGNDIGTGTPRITLTAGGDVGIALGFTTPSYKLHVNGSVAGVGAYNDVSDAREKKNISYDFQHGLQTVRELKPAHFDYLGDGPQNNLGFIAQDIQQVLPGMVTTFNKTVGEGDEATTEERLAIKEANLIAVLVKAVQELDAKVSALEAAQ